MKKRLSRRRGVTLAEVALAATTSVLVLTGSIGTFVMCTKTWLQGESRIDAQSNSAGAIRTISKELREAMSITVDGSGNGLSYRKPSKTGAGDYVMPIVWDGVNRRIELNGTSVRITAEGQPSRVVCSGLRLTDPKSSGGVVPYKIFTPGAGSITRSLTIMLVPERNGTAGYKNNSRIRETIFLRNIPELTR